MGSKTFYFFYDLHEISSQLHRGGEGEVLNNTHFIFFLYTLWGVGILCGDHYVFKVDVAPGGLPMRSKNEFFFFGFLLYIPNYLAPGMESIFRIFVILGFLK